MNVMIVEDDPIVSHAITMALHDEGHRSNVCTTLDHAEHDVAENNYDAIILDLNLPDGDGFEFTKVIRNNKVNTPILIVSGRSSVTDKVVALRAGADGYLTKPFDRQELVANLTAIVRRSNGHSDSVIRTGPISVDLTKHEVKVNNKRVKLSSKEYRMMELLSLRKGSVLTKSHFLSHLYGGIDEPEAKIIDVFICKLRRKLSQHARGHNHIHTVWGQGYVLRDDYERTAPNGKVA